jgi:hypothetical protein
MAKRFPVRMCALDFTLGCRREAVYDVELLDECGVGPSFMRLPLCEPHCRSICKVIADESDLTVLVRAR